MASTTDKADLSTLRINRKNDDSHGSSSKIFLVIGGIVIALLLIAGGFYFLGGGSGTTEVEVATASLTFPSQANALLTASGYIVAQRKAAVASKGTGRLEYLGVEEGDKVKRDHIIARLEQSDVVAALARARAELALAQADSTESSLAFHRQQTLYSNKLVSKAELDAAQARYQRVQASILAAKAGVKSAEVSVENTLIRAPFDGTVLTKSADVGEIVAPFAASASSKGAVVTLADMSSLEAEVDVSESNITRVQPGQPCEIVLDAYPEFRYEGYVHKIVPTADRAKATVLTKVRFKERDNRVLPEMSAKVTFLAKEVEKSEASAGPFLTVPRSAVAEREGSQVVFRLLDGKVGMKIVKTGKIIGEQIVIDEGLQKGDKVILRPEPDLSSGDRVNVK